MVIEENPNMKPAHVMYDKGWMIVKIFNWYDTGTHNSEWISTVRSVSGSWPTPALPGEAAQFVRLGLIESILRSLQTKQNGTF